VPEWSADLTVDEQYARERIERFFVPRSLRLLAEGWDNAVWLADERWVFRFPRRALALPGIRNEIAVLGELSLPLRTPVPRFVGDTFFGAELIPGRELHPGVDRDTLGRPLGEFLRALHAASVSAPLPDDPFGRADMAIRVPKTLQALAQLGCDVPDAVYAARDLPPVEPVCLVHGDLHFRHLLIDGGAISGVIDWGDVCRGDPSMDLPLYWYALSPAGREAFLDAYGPVSEERLLRARVIAIFLCAVLARYGAAEGLESVEREAWDGLRRAS
jgi:aminoglycoside phosphotransferase (APT) family kinase protein